MSAKHGKEFEKGIAQSAVGIFRVNFHNEEI